MSLMHMMCSANKHRKEGQSNLRASSQIMATSIFHRPISGKSWPIYTEQGKLLSFGKENCCSDLSRLKRAVFRVESGTDATFTAKSLSAATQKPCLGLRTQKGTPLL